MNIVDGGQAAVTPVLGSADSAVVLANVLVIPPDLVSRADTVARALNEDAAGTNAGTSVRFAGTIDIKY